MKKILFIALLFALSSTAHATDYAYNDMGLAETQTQKLIEIDKLSKLDESCFVDYETHSKNPNTELINNLRDRLNCSDTKVSLQNEKIDYLYGEIKRLEGLRKETSLIYLPQGLEIETLKKRVEELISYTNELNKQHQSLEQNYTDRFGKLKPYKYGHD